MNTINEFEPQYLDMMHTDISGTSDISWSGAAKGLAGEVVNKGKLPVMSAALLTILTQTHTADAATIIRGVSETTGLPDVNISVENIKNFLEFVGWSPIIILGAAGFISGFTQARSELRDPGFLDWVDRTNTDLRNQIEDANSQKAVNSVKKAIIRGEVPGVRVTKEGKTVNEKGQPIEFDMEPLVDKVLGEMVKVDYGRSRLVIKDPEKDWKWVDVCTRVGFGTLVKYAIPAMLVADTILWASGLFIPSASILGVAGPKLGAEFVLAGSEIISTQNTDIGETVRDEMTPTKKKMIIRG